MTKLYHDVCEYLRHFQTSCILGSLNLTLAAMRSY